MALRNQPYIPFYVQDWLTNNKLKMCGLGSHGLLINLMCLMHKSEEYGKILLKQKFKQSDKQVLNFASMVARLLPFDQSEVTVFLNELLAEKIIRIEDDFLICDRMVNDAELSEKRALSGKKGGKSTMKKSKNESKKDSLNDRNFAQAKSQANSEYEIESVIVSEIVKNKKASTKKDPLEYPFSTPEFFEAWDMLMTSKKWKSKLPRALQISLNKIKEFEEEFAIGLILEAFEKNWAAIVYDSTPEKYQDYLNRKKYGTQHTQNPKASGFKSEREQRLDSVKQLGAVADAILGNADW